MEGNDVFYGEDFEKEGIFGFFFVFVVVYGGFFGYFKGYVVVTFIISF